MLGNKVLTAAKSMNIDVKDINPLALGHYTKVAIKTLRENRSYQHKFNDALVKMHLTALDFARKHDMYDELVEADVSNKMVLLKRLAGVIARTGNKRLALTFVFDGNSCFYQLVEEFEYIDANTLSFRTPYSSVLNSGKKIGLFKGLTEIEIHENFTKPRYKRYGKILGVNFDVSPIDENGRITVRIMD